MFPKLKNKEYSRLKNDPTFLQKFTTVCESCFLKIIANYELSGDTNFDLKQKLKKTTFFGTGKLRPLLKNRFNDVLFFFFI